MEKRAPVLRRRLSVVVPAFNEEAGLEPTVRGVLIAAEAELEDCEIWIVNDGSTDRTGEIADRLSREDSRVRVIHQPRNLGLGAGYAAALERATLDYFTFVPGDNEMHPISFRRIFSKVGTADVVLPYHYNVWDRPWYRRLLTFGCTTLLNVLLGNRLKYYQGPNVYPTTLARVLPRTAGGFFFLTEMTAQAVHLGYGVVHVGLIHQEREHGKSKALSLKNVRRAIVTILKLWWDLTLMRKPITVPTHVAPPRERVERRAWSSIVPESSEKVAV